MRRSEIVWLARGWLGTPYRHQAATRGAGCDCLGLVRGVWRELFGDEPMAVPNYRADWRDVRHADGLRRAAETLLQRVDAMQPGAVVLFRLGRTSVPRHCGVMVDNQRFIHAQEGLGVIEANLTAGWRTRIAGLYDFPGVTF